MVIKWNFFVVKRFKLLNLTASKFFRCQIFSEVKDESSVFSCAKNCLALALILVCERLVHNSNSALFANRKSNENSDCSQVSIYKVLSTIKWINPDNSVFGVETLKQLMTDFISSISLTQNILNQMHALSLVFIEELFGNESLNVVRD